MDEPAILSGFPELFSLELMLKASPFEEGGKRFIYIEASKEAADQQNEIVLAKALENSASHFLRYGSIDLDHKSMPSVAKKHGITNTQEWEIGVPVETRFGGGRTFVKGELYSGDSPLALKANMVWDSMTKLRPQARWYSSVGGIPTAAEARFDPLTKSNVNVITAVRWSNLALTKEPVNQHVPCASLVPVGVFTKALDGFVIAKALEASYATDAVGKTGGAALGMQSLDTGSKNYFDFREAVASGIRDGTIQPVKAKAIVAYAQSTLQLPLKEAAEFTERFMRDINHGLKRSPK